MRVADEIRLDLKKIREQAIDPIKEPILNQLKTKFKRFDDCFFIITGPANIYGEKNYIIDDPREPFRIANIEEQYAPYMEKFLTDNGFAVQCVDGTSGRYLRIKI